MELGFSPGAGCPWGVNTVTNDFRIFFCAMSFLLIHRLQGSFTRIAAILEKRVLLAANNSTLPDDQFDDRNRTKPFSNP